RRTVLHHQAAGARHGAWAFSGSDARHPAGGRTCPCPGPGRGNPGHAGAAARLRRGGSGMTPSGGFSRILLVDDDAILRGQLATALRRRGYTVETAGEATAALETAARFRPEAVILDLKMPGPDGLE